jgi:ATP-dependent helicase/nuclease subunit A
MRWVKAAGGVELALAGLSKTLGVDPAETIDDVEAQYFPVRNHRAVGMADDCRKLSRGGKTMASRPNASPAARVIRSGAERVETYLDIFCTGESADARRANPSSPKRVGDARWSSALLAEQGRVCPLLERRRAVASRDRSAALPPSRMRC